MVLEGKNLLFFKMISYTKDVQKKEKVLITVVALDTSLKWLAGSGIIAILIRYESFNNVFID